MTSTYAAVQPELSATLEKADVAAQRQVVLTVATMILAAVPIPAADEVLRTLRTGGVGESPIRAKLERIGWDAALRHQDLIDLRAENDRDDQPWPADRQRELTESSRLARAAEALVFALSPNTHEAAQEVAYVARFVLPAAEVDDAVRAVLVTQP